MKKHLLVLNGGSSSLKFTVFEVGKRLGKQILDGSISLHGEISVLKYKKTRLVARQETINYQSGYNLKNWWIYILDLLKDYDIRYIGFRMVHGGEEFTDTVKINNSFLKKIAKYNKLAPLHNPITLELMKLVRQTWPRVKMSVSFDTSWHSGLKPEAYLYSLPISFYKKHHIRKYGFHGLSHEAATNYTAKLLNKKINKLKLITCHLGSGGSITWYLDGQVKDTSMGFSPNEGLTMSTRSGDLPPSVVLYLASELKMPLSKINTLLNKQAGLLGLAGMSDLRNILLASGYKVKGYKSSLKFSKEQKKVAKLALDIYIYDIRRYIASYLAMSKKLDAIVFIGPVAVNNTIRSMIMKGLQKPKGTKVLLAPEGESINIANKTIKCLSK
ncbi:MAG: acetate/propionate family kinase [Candidatus Komeilibacteria bacterium]|jgi:acetate kinase|nr:acetate/propionate family kinase [Candidatus Komeilibacteria bacterium]